MTWIYDFDLPSDKDKVRFLVGDTNEDEQLLQDEEIDFCLTNEPTFDLAVALAARGIAAKFSREVEKAVGDHRVSLQQRATAYLELAKEYTQRGGGTAATMRTVAPFVGGISIADKDTREADTDRVLPFFTRETFTSESLLPESDEDA